jgi:WD40 repeat protein
MIAAVVLTGHTDAVLGVRFSPDGTRLVSASEDLMARDDLQRCRERVAASRAAAR